MSNVAGSVLAPGTTVAGYRIEALIGRGGMGAVYRAEEAGLGRKVALKVIAPELAQDERFRERFLRESRIAASLDHPHIVPIYQAGEQDGVLFLAMRYVEGYDLAKLVAENGALEPKRAVELLSQVAEALDAAHEKGLVHRDVKPSNVLVAVSAGREHCYLGDFGLTKRTGSLSGVSAVGEVVGTLEYVAPEQITGDPLDERADVYSLACVLYECLTGQAPFPRATDVALLWAHVHEEPTPPSQARPDLPKELDTVLARGLAKEPGRRYRSAGELLAATRSALGIGDTSSQPTGVRSRRLIAGAAVMVILVIAAVASFLLTRDTGGISSVSPNSVGVIDSGNGKVVSEISVGTSPNAVAVGSDAVWVTNTNDNTVSHIDPSTNTVQQTIQVGAGPVGVAVGGRAVWVANGLDGTVSRINPTINQEVEKITVGNGPSGVAYGEGFVWVTNSVDGTVSRIDPSGNRAPKTFPAAIGASCVAVGFGRVWVVSPASGTVVELDPRSGQVLHTIAVGVEPSAVAIGAGAVWVANRADGTVSKIAPRTGSVKSLISVGPSPNAVAADAKTLWVASQGDGKLCSFDPSTGKRLATTELGGPPAGVALTPGSVYAAVQSAGLEHRGGELRVSSPNAVTSIDPARGFVPIVLATNDGLVGFRKVGGIEGDQIVPDLAVSIPAPTDGGKTYAFQVRSGIHYSNGKLVQPDDFKRAVERLFEAGSDNDFERIVGADRCVRGKPCDLGSGIVTDRGARTVTFHLSAPDPDFLAKLAQPEAFAVPAGTPAQDVGTHPIPATGPYRIAFFGKKTMTMRLVRNRFFREWSPDAQPHGYPDSISFSWRLNSDNQTSGAAALRNQAARLRAVERGAADIAVAGVFQALPKTVIDRLSVLYPGQLHLNTTLATAFYFLNTRAAPFTDVRVRRAVNIAFDRQAFGRIGGRSQAPTCRYLPPGTLGYKPTCPYGSGGVAGLETARRLVRSSGTAGARVMVWAFESTDQERFMVSVLDSLGYRASLKVVNGFNAYWTQVADSRVGAQTGFIAYVGAWPSPFYFLPYFVSCAGFIPASPGNNPNPSEFCDPAIDAQMAHASTVQAQDPPAATVLWQRVESALAVQAPYVPIYNSRNVDLVSKRVGNYQYNPTSGALLSQLWVK